jgi:hypothetical protein
MIAAKDGSAERRSLINVASSLGLERINQIIYNLLEGSQGDHLRECMSGTFMSIGGTQSARMFNKGTFLSLR